MLRKARQRSNDGEGVKTIKRPTERVYDETGLKGRRGGNFGQTKEVGTRRGVGCYEGNSKRASNEKPRSGVVDLQPGAPDRRNREGGALY
jgi:hypothetical protein